jgi:excisionase family DNA binding protein
VTEKIFLDIQAVAERTSLSERTVKELLRRGDIKSLKVGARRLIHAADLDEFAERLRAEAER